MQLHVTYKAEGAAAVEIGTEVVARAGTGVAEDIADAEVGWDRTSGRPAKFSVLLEGAESAPSKSAATDARLCPSTSLSLSEGLSVLVYTQSCMEGCMEGL